MATTKSKPATKKPATKRTTTKKVAKQPVMQSFKPAPDTEPFFTFRITHQTVYWFILSMLVLALGIWVTYLNIKVQHIYDQIDRSSALRDVPVITSKKND